MFLSRKLKLNLASAAALATTVPSFSQMKVFYQAKRPRSEHYPFEIEDPYQSLGLRKGYKHLTLVGDNWRETDPNRLKPIAVLFGFNSWKLGFIAAYLPEFRCAFFKRKVTSIRSLAILGSLNPAPVSVIAWGMNEPFAVRRFAQAKKIRFFRMEDGFIRSTTLGSSHSTPYSLVLDSQGIYYDPTSPSDIEQILNEYDFSRDEKLRSDAISLQSFVQEHGLSKYNSPVKRRPEASGHPLSNRVLVVGQVHKDASLRLGNPDGWKIEDLVLLARQENPDAEIIYRPHPDVYEGYQKSPVKLARMERIATVLSPHLPLSQTLEAVSKVYTITSLVGLEAVLRGIKVITVGLPFYAGWGLTDDRCVHIALSRRTRTLTKEELAAGCYFVYPRYLANLSDARIGATATAYRLAGEVEVANSANPDLKRLSDRSHLKKVAASDDWPQIFSNLGSPLSLEQAKIIAKNLNIDELLANASSTFFHKVFLARVAGQLRYIEAIEILLLRCRERVNSETLNFVLLALWNNTPDPSFLTHFGWLLQKSGAEVEGRELIKSSLARKAPEKGETGDVDNLTSADEPAALKPMSSQDAQALIILAKTDLRTNRSHAAMDSIGKLLIAGERCEEATSISAESAMLNFDFASALAIALLNSRTASKQTRALMHIVAMKSIRHLPTFDAKQFARSTFGAAYLSPQSTITCLLFAEMFKERYKLNDFSSYLIGAMSCDNKVAFEKAQGYIALEMPSHAVKILRSLLHRDGDHYRTLSLLSQAYSYLRDFAAARATIEYAMEIFPNAYTFKEGIRLSIIMNDGEWGKTILRRALDCNLDLGEMMQRKLHYVNRDISAALELYRHIKLRDKVRYYYPNHFISTEELNDYDFSGDTLVVLGIMGPGDEIRYAQIYSEINNDPQIGKVIFTCDPRIKMLLERSFPDLKFKAVARVREYGVHFAISNYNELPAYDLHHFLDNDGHREMSGADKAVFVTDFLARYRTQYQDFTGSSFLVADEKKVSSFRERLSGTTKALVGLSWRSSLTTFSRNEHYLSVQDLEPLLAMDGCQFINLQYDDCSEELAWIEAKYPGKVINFPDLDQYNDLDSVAALMKSLDLIITPATTVVELAGALGCPTMLLSNSAELHWRKTENGSADIWHNSVVHVEGTDLGNKASLVESAALHLADYIQQHTTSIAS